MNDWGEIKTDWNDKVNFVNRHEASNKIIDFTDKQSLNELFNELQQRGFRCELKE